MRGRAIVGGLEFAVGGWGEYEADRRVALSALGSRPGANYPGRSTLRPGDAIQSLVAGGGADSHFDRPRNRALTRAARRLQAALGRLEDELCSLSEDGVWECAGPREPTLTIPPLTSSDLRAFLEDPAQQTDPEALSELGAAAGIVAASLGEVLPPLPPPPDEVAEPEAAIPVEDDEAVLRLEASVLPRVRGLEELQARVATRLDRVAEAVEKRPASAN